MLPELYPWIGMFSLLKADVLKGCGPDLLRRGKATDEDYEVFLAMDNVLNNWRIKQTQKKTG